ncbi:hypothetical protein [Phenylobacterium sp.]|uniref:hypothetical protein n=1 Tax=Phenylobacterium sp. TaxID=1871053 RepID=UPI003BA9BFAF
MTAHGSGRLLARGAAIVLGAAIVGLGLQTVGRRAPVAVSFPIDLRPGVTSSPVFRAAYNEPYGVGLEVERVMPFETTNCLLGARDLTGPDYERPAYCGDTPSPVDLEWVLYEGAQTVERGRAESGQAAAYGPTITRNLGTARLRPGHDYRIEVRSNRDASALAPARPRITLEVHPMVWKDEWVLRSLGVLAALGVGVFGACMMIVGGVRWMLEKARLARGRD